MRPLWGAAMATVTAPPIVQINVAEVQALLVRLQPQVAPGDYQMVDSSDDLNSTTPETTPMPKEMAKILVQWRAISM